MDEGLFNFLTRDIYYKLVNQTPIPINALEFELWMQTADRRVKLTKYPWGDVSTVFLGIDHNYDPDSPPLLFETLIFGGTFDGYMWRYSNYEEALHYHNLICQKLDEGIDKIELE